MKLHWQIAIALALALVAGMTIGEAPWFLQTCAFFGTIFLNALKMLIVPLIVSAIICGLAGIGDSRTLGRMGWHTLLFYMGTGLLAILTGLLMVNLLSPGIIDGVPAAQRLGLAADTGQVVAGVRDRGTGDLLAVLQRLVPANPIGAAADADMLGVVTFTLLFAWALAQLPEATRRTQQEFWQGVYQAMLRIADLVMRFAPLGVFALVGGVVAKTGLAALRPLAVFFVAVVLGLLVHATITLPLVLRLVARVSPLAHFRAVGPALLTAFSTSSSNATLPLTLSCLRERAGVSERVTGFVLPIGANVNTDGTALYECAAALFIAQAYGLELGVATQFTVVLMALLTSVGVAGIPSASLVAIALILGAIGLPLEGVGLILAVDRVLDMCRTTVNVLGDTVATVTVARLDGEDVLQQRSASPL
ncbi:dicarboxylate/amino acid:cation symporter [Solimonas sp. K1W22B-7]|uniref:dicarboxylate/amino acid:cation symporter n=1 Tax=Solimonas sp. K1W22B-7 TaxID=2303331 RepID=UPI000E32F316|nr:dicarboxylate/amino acid:cation symporter [Solimonas sp. K1W22B-7]AXQ27647.1 dicarboxylate/amino acid:cation symporter [Solimonas sp. K1W22B-7]